MRKLLLGFMLVVMSCIPFCAQDLYVGLGHIWEGNGNLVKNVDTGSLQYQLGFSYDVSKNWYMAASIHRDTVKVENYLLDHNYIDEVVSTYEYTIVDIGGGYILNPGDKVKVKVGMFLSGYFSPDNEVDSKLGVGAEVKAEYAFYKNWFAYFGVKFRHTQEFIAPQVNVLETSYGIGFRF